MRPRNREVEIFNMSLLDILCGALGAFCFMMLALFPSYIQARRTGVDPAKHVEQDATKREKWQQVKSSVAHSTVVIRWDTPHDIDLYLQAQGAAHWFGPKRLPGRGDTSLDPSQDSREAGSESRSYAPGDIRIMYRVAARNGASAPAIVYGFVSARTGLFTDAAAASIALPAVELGADGEAVAAELKWNTFSRDAVQFRRVGS